jgi:hypothetical protein
MLKHVSTYEFPADDLMEVICAEKFNIEAQSSREDVVEAKFVIQEDGGDLLKFSVPYTHYKRGKTGGLDKSVIESSRTDYELRRGKRELLWWHRGSEEKGRIRIEGVTRFVPLGPNRARIERDVTIDIRIPLVGKTIAKYVEKEFRKAYDDLTSRINASMRSR